MEEMFRYKMVNNNKCKRCGDVETYKHLMWECKEARQIWKVFNEYLTKTNQQEVRVLEYEKLYTIGSMGFVNKVKMRVIQEMIQINRPANWTMENINWNLKELKSLELFNAKKVHKETNDRK
jgi:hypothetical protein